MMEGGRREEEGRKKEGGRRGEEGGWVLVLLFGCGSFTSTATHGCTSHGQVSTHLGKKGKKGSTHGSTYTCKYTTLHGGVHERR